jgi:transcriptional antiterminator RfaH
VNWYLLQTKSRQEIVAEINLVRQGFVCYQPSLVFEKVVSGKITKVCEPLFPGYMFIRIAAGQNWLPIRSTYGVKDLVKFGGRALPVPEKMIAELIDKCSISAPQDLFLRGQKVKINEGAFSGLDAVFICKKGSDRVVVLINLLHTSQHVALPADSLVRCG